MLEPKVENPIGIDLGTTNCCVAFIQNGHVQIIPNTKTDERTTPSYVFYTGKGVHVGKLAFNNVVLHPERVVYDAKRMIGRSFHDQNIQKNLPYWKFAVEEDPQTSKPIIRLPNDLILTPEDVSSAILRYLKSQAESFTGKPVRNAVITVPAYFNYNQRTATQKAAEEAGFKVLQIINEPTAAALAYVDANYRENGCEKTIVVYDLGGGTFDVSILRIKKDENGEEFRVLGTSGDTYLGGRDFDNNLIDLVLKKVRELGLRVDKILTRRIAAQVILKKIELTEAEHTDVLLPVIDNDDVEDVALRITREEFEQINMHLFKRSIDILDTSIRAANLTKEEVDEVVLVGGSSKIPKIQEMVRDFFKNAHVTESVSSSEAVAHGAALWAATFSEEDTKRLIIADVTPLSLGTEIARGRMNFLVKRNSLIPTEVKATYRTSVDNQTRAVFQIYEGERLLVKDKTRLGSFNIEFPPLPLYHPIDVVFRVNVNGILEVGAEVDSKIYSNVQIVYDPTDVAKAVDFAEEADFMRNLDAAAMKRVKRLDNFENYFIRISSLCDRSKKFEAEEKDALLKVCCEQLVWSTAISDSEVTEEVDRKIVERRNEAEAVTEPILQKYGYKVRSVSRRHFTEFLQSLNETEVE